MATLGIEDGAQSFAFEIVIAQCSILKVSMSIISEMIKGKKLQADITFRMLYKSIVDVLM